MEFFQRAKVFRLKCSHHSKYLLADEDEDRIKQTRDSSSNRARWYYELVEGKANVIRIRSSSNHRYLAASEDPFLLGMTGKKVIQTIRQGAILEWQVIKQGLYIKLMSHTGSFLRANPRVPPWRNSVTHDEPANWTATDHMILWIVDIVEMDYSSTGAQHVKQGISSVQDQKPVNSDSFNKLKSELSSLNDDLHNPKSQGASPDTVSETQNSDSFNKLKSELSSLNDDLHNPKSQGASPDTVSGYGQESTSDESEHMHQIEVTMAKKTFKELKDLDFHTILSSNRDKKLEKVIKVLIADAQMSSQGDVPSDLLHLQEKLELMKSEHDSASQDLIEYTNFSTQRVKLMAELKKDAAQARELETLQVELGTLRAQRKELVKQLEDIEHIIKDLETTQANNLEEVEELISRMGQKSHKLEEMKVEEETWQVKITEANRMLERVEEEWEKIKTMFLDD
ncbi:hypothetical protein BVRB_2g040570 isoform A [Beta vulgaris subsp. vulgaris]|nr:hypothetical protein BVRB_2g040570 isoform A [Beta vulgaris subsp. vulgaris]